MPSGVLHWMSRAGWVLDGLGLILVIPAMIGNGHLAALDKRIGSDLQRLKKWAGDTIGSAALLVLALIYLTSIRFLRVIGVISISLLIVSLIVLWTLVALRHPIRRWIKRLAQDLAFRRLCIGSGIGLLAVGLALSVALRLAIRT